MSRNVANILKVADYMKKTIFMQNKAAAHHAMPVWQLLDDGIQGNDLVLKDKQKCQQVALNWHCPGKGREGKGKEGKGTGSG